MTPREPIEHPLAEMLMYRLYQAWSQSNPVFVRLCEGRFGITRREWRLLACAVEGGIMTSAELAAAAKLDLARTSRTLGALCGKRLAAAPARQRRPPGGAHRGHRTWPEPLPRPAARSAAPEPVSYTHLTLPTNREV